ncbi:MAG: hypothetical protein MK108_11045 [Mariniblastus sp.]|nr:hypothetical protein [Mariniblastus sp.]
MKYRTMTFLGILALVVLFPSNSVLAETRYVPSKVYRTIQSAIDAANAGDVIVIAAGKYSPTATIDTLGKAITLSGAVDRKGLPATIIDGQGKMRVLQCVETTGGQVVFENLQIQNGWVDGSGGGVFFSGGSAKFINCLFKSNSAVDTDNSLNAIKGYGGGLCCLATCPVLINCHFESNSAYRSGGGAYCNRVDFRLLDHPRNLYRVPFQNCTFTNNSANGNDAPSEGPPVTTGQRQGGGGLCLSQCFYSNNPKPHSILDHCEFKWNLSTVGGGLLLDESQGVVHPLLTDCTFRENRCVVDVARNGNGGGGIGMFNSRPTIRDCDFEGNFVEFVGRNGKGEDIGGGGAMRTWFNSGVTSPEDTVIDGCTFTNNIVSGGASGGAFLYDAGNDHDDPQITGCQFTGNSALGGRGGAVFNIGPGGDPTFSNCDFEDNSADEGGGMYNSYISPTLTDCTFAGNWAVDNGGGMCNSGSNSSGSSPTLNDCTLTGNLAVNNGGGIYNDQETSPYLDGCEITGNAATNGAGGGIYSELPSGGTTLRNSRVCGNSPDQIYGNWTDEGGNTVHEPSPDLNDDGWVDGADVGLLLVDWGASGDCLPADLNGDGWVDGADFGLLLAAWGEYP